MSTTVSNVSFGGSPVCMQIDSPFLLCFDPLALDLLGPIISQNEACNLIELLDLANQNISSVACLTIPSFRPGWYQLDPRHIKKFGSDDDLEFGDNENESVEDDPSP
jgi:hypothetical protein